MSRLQRLVNIRCISIIISTVICLHIIIGALMTIRVRPVTPTAAYSPASHPSQLRTHSIPSTISNKMWNKPEDNWDFFRPGENRVTPLDFDIVLKCSNACFDPPFLVILVLTMHSHVEERQVIRETWGRIAYGKQWPRQPISEKIKIIFLLGTQPNELLNDIVQKELERTEDVVMFNFEESYFNLTYKVLMGFKWVKLFCPRTQFVMKIDEDMFIDMPQLVNKLHSPVWATNICGLYFNLDKAYRKGKYKVSQDVYPFHYYPPHVKGNIYFMPMEFVLRILTVAEYMPYVNMEDVHITGILALTAGVNNYQRFAKENFHSWGVILSCNFNKEHVLATASIRPQHARDIWTTIEVPTVCNYEVKT